MFKASESTASKGQRGQQLNENFQKLTPLFFNEAPAHSEQGKLIVSTPRRLEHLRTPSYPMEMVILVFVHDNLLRTQLSTDHAFVNWFSMDARSCAGNRQVILPETIQWYDHCGPSKLTNLSRSMESASAGKLAGPGHTVDQWISFGRRIRKQRC